MFWGIVFIEQNDSVQYVKKLNFGSTWIKFSTDITYHDSKCKLENCKYLTIGQENNFKNLGMYLFSYDQFTWESILVAFNQIWIGFKKISVMKPH